MDVHAVIVSNGMAPKASLIKSETEKADLVIGADGGGNALLEQNISPDVVIGDLDSFIKPNKVHFELIHDPDQETNDLEKALKYASDQGAESCTVLGMYGLRMDHALKNISVLKQFTPKFKQLVFKDDRFSTWHISQKIEAKVEKGTVISLFPLSGKTSGIVTKGLKYSLDDESLENGLRDGTSNEASEELISVEVKEGDLVVFIENKGTVEVVYWR
ncbi:thiamine diphosphokinase [Gracilimonas mengyeensis]|uniref:Thiamine diphosphokinase n=1 Tax=Gracilimonas mengyeensis TaxID=1302730 RepID=A0A521DDZ8_9BACT|nr:thiamine diphosphokinase [Gracilimonas mengyeensis]SMO69863.1 thiamine pyrophosphokinase [Gracilimonas mengyeensis]